VGSGAPAVATDGQGGSVTLLVFLGHAAQGLMATKIEVPTLASPWLLKRYIGLLRGCYQSGGKSYSTRLPMPT
jgi:hypothetical protein